MQIDRIAAGIDLLPTLSDLVGISWNTANPIDVVSLEPLILEQTDTWKERLIYSHWNGRISVRSQEWRFDHEGRLHNLQQYPGQHNNVAEQFPELAQSLADSLEKWQQDVLSGLGEDDRPFPVGHPDFRYTQLPARDGVAHGNIERSNRFPNVSFMRGKSGL